MAHVVVPEAESLLDQEIPVLDKGFVRLVDYLGGDERVVQAARVSYGKGTKTVREDAKLIAYLMRNEHWSPFEQVQLTFHVKLPIFVARQWIRHRTARLNEISARYSVMTDEFWRPPDTEIRAQSKRNKQGRDEAAVMPEADRRRVGELLDDVHAQSYAAYDEMIKMGLAREIARVALPVSLYTQWYWQIDLRNLLHFVGLRADPHAQAEIRAYAEVLLRCARAVAPATCDAFDEYIRLGKRLSRDQAARVAQALATSHPELLAELGWNSVSTIENSTTRTTGGGLGADKGEDGASVAKSEMAPPSPQEG